MNNLSNLKKWEKGQSGNPNGRPMGSRNVRLIVRDLLNDKGVYSYMSSWNTDKNLPPVNAIVIALITKALDGDIKSAELLLKYADTRNSIDTASDPVDSIFTQKELKITVVEGREQVERLEELQKSISEMANSNG